MVVGFAAHGQLNDYKYIIVPKKFADFKGVNKHQTSTLVKYYFTQNGFTAVYDDALPLDLATNRCLGLVAELLDESSMFSTTVIISLKDCKNVEVFRSAEGKSKVKEYDQAYKEAIQDAFSSFSGMDYKYQPKEEEVVKEDAPVTISFKDDVKKVVEKPEEKVIEQKSTLEEQVYKSVEPRPSNITKAVEKNVESEPLTSGLLYAQPIEGGFQLVDSTPKVVLKLQETSMDNIFLTQYMGSSAMVFQKEGKWFLEYLENGGKQLKELNIKF
jgi:hypothetical protein